MDDDDRRAKIAPTLLLSIGMPRNNLHNTVGNMCLCHRPTLLLRNAASLCPHRHYLPPKLLWLWAGPESSRFGTVSTPAVPEASTEEGAVRGGGAAVQCRAFRGPTGPSLSFGVDVDW